MKANFFVEFQGQQSADKELLTRIKKVWTDEGNRLGDIKLMNIYIKPEENTVYYVINETIHGKIELCE